jgi:hypothetical protein
MMKPHKDILDAPEPPENGPYEEGYEKGQRYGILVGFIICFLLFGGSCLLKL